MPTHTARVIDKETVSGDEKYGPENQVEDLGINGIAFSVICCESLRTVRRVTLSHLHLMDGAGRQRVMELHCQQVAEHHMKTRKAIEHIRSIHKGGTIQASVEQLPSD